MKANGMLTLLVLSGFATFHCSGSSNAPVGPGDEPVVDGGVTGNQDCVPSAVDDPDDDGRDTNCDGADGIVGQDTYVDPVKGADTNTGTPAAPFRTLTRAIKQAMPRRGRVLALAGTYQVDVLSFEGGEWNLYGGYGAGFGGPPKREQTILSPAADTGLVLETTSKIGLAHVTIEGRAPSDPKQPTAYALRTRGGQISLDDVLVRASDGLSMPDGKAGEPGQHGNKHMGELRCDGVGQPEHTWGAWWGEKSREGKTPGVYYPDNPAASVRGEKGTDGAPGTDGEDGKGALKVVDGLLVGDVGTRGLDNGMPGYGAAGGAPDPSRRKYAVGGDGGSGGCPGRGGEGAQSGGHSVAVIATTGTITVRRSRLVSGIGGNGGNGGAGGAGGHGGWGGSPYSAGELYPAVDCKSPSDDPLGGNCAPFGGVGGSGGSGGHGGGGAGGSSIAIGTIGTAEADVDPSTEIVLGPVGTGGAGSGGGRAPAGKRIATVRLP